MPHCVAQGKEMSQSEIVLDSAFTFINTIPTGSLRQKINHEQGGDCSSKFLIEKLTVPLVLKEHVP
jgi:hypothetical protein